MLIKNHRAYRDYLILEEKEAGVSLLGPEVKSLRAGQATLDNSFIEMNKKGFFLNNAYIAPYSASFIKINPRRKRQLLLKEQEILNWQNKVQQKKLTIIPLEWYNKDRLVKLKIGLGKKKKVKKRLKREMLAKS